MRPGTLGWLAAGRCELERPAFLQYLVIDGRRTLIGTGYVCDADDPEPAWFGASSIWHSHGPELCRFRKGAFMDASYFARALPNEVSEETWQELSAGGGEHRRSVR
jgi:hypothetical protein